MMIQSVVSLTAACGLAAVVSAGAWATLVAQTSASDDVVVMGCVTQQAAGEGERGGEQALLVITDTRSKPPRKFILHGNAGQLAWHVGHTLEIHAHVARRESTGAVATDAQLPVLDVQSVVYLQPTCVAPPK
jgi:hypothetical protein